MYTGGSTVTQFLDVGGVVMTSCLITYVHVLETSNTSSPKYNVYVCIYKGASVLLHSKSR